MNPRQALLDLVRSAFLERPEDVLVEMFASQNGISLTDLRAAIDSIWPEQPAPYLLFDFGETDLRPGQTLAPEGHVRFAGWEGNVEIRMSIDGRLDKEHWRESPPLSRLASGYWTFPQTLSLTDGRQQCQNGKYWIHFHCRFDGPHHSVWEGRIKMTISHGEDGPSLVIDSDEHSLVNLNGVNLKEFSRVQIQARGNSLVNIQSMLEALRSESATNSGTGRRSDMIPVQLIPYTPPPPPQASHTTARVDLPSGRRVVLFAQDQLTLGRNRPDPNARSHRTDVALRMHPRSELNDAVSLKISRQQLKLSVCDGQVEFFDPREADQQSAKPATLNGQPLPPSPIELIPDRAYHYDSALGHEERIGLDLIAYHDDRKAEYLQDRLEQLPRTRTSTTWRRDSTRYDAIRIERSGFTDDYDGREAYLMLMGMALIGSSPRCAIQVEGSGIRTEHAALLHWDGQFRLTPWGSVPVYCDQQLIYPGQVVTLTPDANHTLRLGDTLLQFGPRAQLVIDP